jgi:ubiquitin-like modifier-activating enzyme ATG7
VWLELKLAADSCSVDAPADSSAGPNDTSSEGSPLGLVPHQLRGMLGQWKTMLVEGSAYDKCTACSKVVSTKLAFMAGD